MHLFDRTDSDDDGGITFASSFLHLKAELQPSPSLETFTKAVLTAILHQSESAMLPFRASSVSPTRRPRGLDRLFAGTPIGVSSTGTYGTFLASPVTPATSTRQEQTNQLARMPGRGLTNADDMKRACGLPDQITYFIINISAADLRTSATDQTNAATTAADNNQLVPSTARSPLAAEDNDQNRLVFWPSTLRPRAVVDQEPEPIVPSSFLSLVLWTKKTELATLPLEIRTIIYEKLLEPSASTEMTVPANDATATVRLVVPNLQASVLKEQAQSLRGAKSLLQTSKQLRSEFLPLFAARYNYTLTSTAQLLSLGLGNRPLGALSLAWTHLKHVELSTDATVLQAREIRAFLQLSCLAIYLLPALETLTITQLPAAFSPVRFYTSKAGTSALSMDTYRCRRLARYGHGTQNVSADHFAMDVFGIPGWRVGFFRLGEILQGWMRSEGEEEFALFGHVYVASGSAVALALTLQTEGKWRKARRSSRSREAEEAE